MEMSSSNSNSSLSRDKMLNMTEFISAVNEYIRTKTDNSALIIKKCLQAYSVTIDLHIFDPDSTVGSQFYVSLYELFNSLEPQSPLAWECVDTLTNACRNCRARQALINTYQFLPILSRLLGNQLTSTKKKKLLRLIQDVTCGIKLSWQIPHLPHLLTVLTEWVQGDDEDVACLSLGVLVNVCYKNLPAVYSLSRVVDIKKFLKYCLSLRGSLIEVHVCKLMIIMDHTHEEIPKKTLLNLIEPTFNSIVQSFIKDDPVMMRMVVDFFVEMVVEENADIFREYQHFNEQVSKLIQLTNKDDLSSRRDPDCVNLLLKFIHVLETKQLGNLSSLYPDMVNLALNWVNSKRVSLQALLVLGAVTQNSNETDNDNFLHFLIKQVPVFLNMLTSQSINLEEYQRLGLLLQLLRYMLKSNSIRKQMLQNLDEKLLSDIFRPIISDEFNQINLPKIRFDGTSTTSTEVIDAYVFALGLIHELSQHDAKWLDTLSTLMENKTVHEILALALYGSKDNVKQLVLEVSKCPKFPIQKVAVKMSALQNMWVGTSKTNLEKVSSPFDSGSVPCPVLTVPQTRSLDEVLAKLNRLIEENDPMNIPTKKVMELYEYKIASLVHSESFALKSIQAASERCVHLQHRLAQLTEEHNKLRQAMYQSEVRLSRTMKGVEEMREANLEVKKEIAKREQIILETETKLKAVKVQLLEMTEQKNNLQEEVMKYEQTVQKLEKNGQRYEQELQKREEKLRNSNIHIDSLNQRNQDLQKLLTQREAKLTEVTKQYNEMKEVITHITKMANSQLS